MLNEPPGPTGAEPAVSTPTVTAEAFTSVESLAPALTEPPPDTLTELISGELAAASTLTTTVIGG